MVKLYRNLDPTKHKWGRALRLAQRGLLCRREKPIGIRVETVLVSHAAHANARAASVIIINYYYYDNDLRAPH